MSLKYRMSNSSNNSKGLFGALGDAISGATNAVTKAVAGNSKNNTKKNNNSVKNTSNSAKNMNIKKNSVVPVTAGVNAPTQPNSTAPQAGGVAPLNFRYPANMQQPSERIMQWATTAGMPAPPDMRGVAHGGKRSTRRRSTKRRSTHMRKSYKKLKGGKRHSKSHRRVKSHKRRHTKRRN